MGSGMNRMWKNGVCGKEHGKTWRCLVGSATATATATAVSRMTSASKTEHERGRILRLALREREKKFRSLVCEPQMP